MGLNFKDEEIKSYFFYRVRDRPGRLFDISKLSPFLENSNKWRGYLLEKNAH
jgi:hypothetical protein